MRDFVLSLQRKEEGRIQGGFGYNTAKSADLSNAQFAIAALRGAGIPEDHEAMVKARAFLERAQNRSENEANKGASYELEEKGMGIVKVVPGNDGSAGYEPGVSKAGLEKLPDGTFVVRGYGSMTYALLKCYLLAGVPKEDERVKAAISWLGKNYTWEENPGFAKAAVETGQKDAPYWGLFYYYMTAAKALQLAGVEKLETPAGARDWKADLGNAILSRQQPDGSWKNDKSPRWEEGDPLLVTSYAVIALEDLLAAK
jgi:squalene-hopene/tetraprenyl-beta-curcumene cyclase